MILVIITQGTIWVKGVGKNHFSLNHYINQILSVEKYQNWAQTKQKGSYVYTIISSFTLSSSSFSCFSSPLPPWSSLLFLLLLHLSFPPSLSASVCLPLSLLISPMCWLYSQVVDFILIFSLCVGKNGR